MYPCGSCCRQTVKGFAAIGVFAFLAGYLWYYTIQDPALRILHENLFRISVLGYTGHNAQSAIFGVIEWALYGAILGGLFAMCIQSHRCERCQLNVAVE